MCTWGSHEHVHVRLARARPLYTNLLPGVVLGEVGEGVVSGGGLDEELAIEIG